jgi:hypothetical protein
MPSLDHKDHVMTSHSTFPASGALRASSPRLTILVLAFAARLLLAGCAATPSVLETTSGPATSDHPIAQAPRHTVSNAPDDEDVRVLSSSEDDLAEGEHEEVQGGYPTSSDARHDFIPGC